MCVLNINPLSLVTFRTTPNSPKVLNNHKTWKRIEGIDIAISYVLINTIPEHEHDVYNMLSDNPLVIELNPLFHEFDLIAKVKTKNKKKLGSFISNKIRSLEGVIDTKIIQ